MGDSVLCSGCGEPLKVEEWNSTMDMAVCNNYKCTLFRTPVQSGKRVIEKVERQSEPELPDWIGGTHGGKEKTKFTARLQRLRHRLYAKD